MWIGVLCNYFSFATERKEMWRRVRMLWLVNIWLLYI